MKAAMMAFLVLVVACGGGVEPILPPISLAVVAGDSQTAPILTALAPVVVRATDARGAPVRGQAVTWSVSDDGGTIPVPITVTNDSGRAVQRWTLESRAGVHALTGKLLDSTGTLLTLVITATAQPLVAAIVRVSWGPNVRQWYTNDASGRSWGSWKGGDTVEVAIGVFDDYSNIGAPCADAGDWKRMTWEASKQGRVSFVDYVARANVDWKPAWWSTQEPAPTVVQLARFASGSMATSDTVVLRPIADPACVPGQATVREDRLHVILTP